MEKRVPMLIHVPHALRHGLKVAAAREERTMLSLAVEALERLLEARRTDPVAPTGEVEP